MAELPLPFVLQRFGQVVAIDRHDHVAFPYSHPLRRPTLHYMDHTKRPVVFRTGFHVDAQDRPGVHGLIRVVPDDHGLLFLLFLRRTRR